MSTHSKLPATPAAGATALWPGVSHQTPWQGLHRLTIADGDQARLETGEETAIVLLQGALCVEGSRLEAPAAIVGTGLAVSALGPVELLKAPVHGSHAAPSVRHDRFDPGKLTWRDAIHGGQGTIATRHLWGPDDFDGAWVFIDHAILGADSSLGHHYHEGGEEAFIVLSGSGWMTIDDETFDVSAGSVTYQPIGASHGLYNPNDEGLDFIRLAVGVPGEPFTTIDVDDDLRRRRPGATA